MERDGGEKGKVEVRAMGVVRGVESDESGPSSDLRLQYSTGWTAERVPGHKAQRYWRG